MQTVWQALKAKLWLCRGSIRSTPSTADTQQQPVYVQQPNQGYGNAGGQQGCMEGCLAALCCLFALEACFLF